MGATPMEPDALPSVRRTNGSPLPWVFSTRSTTSSSCWTRSPMESWARFSGAMPQWCAGTRRPASVDDATNIVVPLACRDASLHVLVVVYLDRRWHVRHACETGSSRVAHAVVTRLHDETQLLHSWRQSAGRDHAPESCAHGHDLAQHSRANQPAEETQRWQRR